MCYGRALPFQNEVVRSGPPRRRHLNKDGNQREGVNQEAVPGEASWAKAQQVQRPRLACYRNTSGARAREESRCGARTLQGGTAALRRHSCHRLPACSGQSESLSATGAFPPRPQATGRTELAPPPPVPTPCVPATSPSNTGCQDPHPSSAPFAVPAGSSPASATAGRERPPLPTALPRGDLAAGPWPLSALLAPRAFHVLPGSQLPGAGTEARQEGARKPQTRHCMKGGHTVVCGRTRRAGTRDVGRRSPRVSLARALPAAPAPAPVGPVVG